MDTRATYASLSDVDTRHGHTATSPYIAGTADGYVVCTWWQDPASVVPPYKGTYGYEHFATLNEALADYAEIERGEHPKAREVGIFPAKSGLPFGPALSPHYLAMLLREVAA